MESIVSELPLAIFTACVLLGAGGYAAWGIECAVQRPQGGEHPQGGDASEAKTDKRPIIFLCIVLVGFVAAFFHLASPTNAAFALTGIGRSPMSNEIAAGLVFTVAAALYCFLAMTGRLKESADRAYSIALAVLGLLFAVFTGAAYMMDTIVTWSTPLSAIESAGLSLLAGAVLSLAFKALLGGAPLSKAAHTALLVTAAAGLVIGFGALGLHVFQTGQLHSSMVQGSALAQGATVPLIASAAAGLASLLLCLPTAGGKATKKVLPFIALVLIVLSVFAARLVFYGIQLSVGL